MLKMSHETFDRPFITLLNRAQSNMGKFIVLNKFEILNLNPYVVVVEDKSIINIYSFIEPHMHYLFKIEERKRLLCT